VTAASSRPRDVALAGVLTIIGSVLALVGIFSAQGELRTSDVRRDIEGVLADDRFAAIDISVDAVLALVEYALMVASAASVAAIVLAVFVMRRHNPSRIALTVLGGCAVLVLLLSWPTGVITAIFVAYTLSLLWRAPVRSWFAGARPAARGAGAGTGTWAMSGTGPGGEPEPERNPDAVPESDPRWPSDPGPPDAGDPSRPVEPRPGGGDPRPAGGGEPGPYPQPWPPASPQPGQPGQPEPGQSPPADQGHRYPPAYPSAGPPAYPSAGPPGYPPGPGYGYGYPSGYQGYPPVAHDPDRRPGQVIGAHVMTWISTALGLVTGAVVVMVLGSQELLDQVLQQVPLPEGVSRDEFVRTTRVESAVLAAWSLAVLVVSVFSWRRANWAAILLTVMGGTYLVVQVVRTLTGDLPALVTVVWVAAVLVLLWWPTSRQWYAGARRTGGHAGPPGGGSPYGAWPTQPRQPPAQPPRRNQPW
jgi:hypothetical protein